MRNIPMTMADWAIRLDRFIQNEKRGGKVGGKIRKINLIRNKKNELRKAIDEIVEDVEGN